MKSPFTKIFLLFLIFAFVHVLHSPAEELPPLKLTLKEAFQRVLASDQSIQIAFYAIQQAELGKWSTLTTYGPRLTGSLTFNHDGDTSASGTPDTGSAGLTYRQSIYDPTFISKYRIAKLSTASSELQKEFNTREVLFGLAKAYFTVLKNEDLLKLNQETLKLASSQMDLAEARYQAGDVAHTDVLRAKVQVQSSKQAVIETENNLDFSCTQLLNILNLPNNQSLNLTPPEHLFFDEEPLDQLSKRAFERREDLEASAISVQQEVQKRKTVLAGYAPTLTGTMSQNWSDFSSKSSDSGWSASVGLSMPFLEGGQREIDLKNADYAIRTAQLNHEKLRKSIQNEIFQAWFQSRSLRESLKTLSVSVEAAEQTYRDVKAQYEAGTATSVDTLVALRDLNSSRTDFSTKTYDYQISLFDLKRASGDLKENLDP